jgi:predicted ATPase
VLWQCGYPDQAVDRSDEALQLVLEASHSYSTTVMRCLLTSFYLLRRDWQTAQEQAETSMTLATEQGFPLWRAWAMSWRGAALAAQGHGVEGIVQSQEGLVALRAMGVALNITQLLALLAEAYHTTGQTKQGLAMLVEALEVMVRTGERFYEAELHRLKGELLLQQSPDNAAEADSCFQQAISIAQNQSAKSWELRAATSLAHLWQSQGKRDEARELLEPVYSWFTEGHDTADLKDAKALLDELA